MLHVKRASFDDLFSHPTYKLYDIIQLKKRRLQSTKKHFESLPEFLRALFKMEIVGRSLLVCISSDELELESPGRDLFAVRSVKKLLTLIETR